MFRLNIMNATNVFILIWKFPYSKSSVLNKTALGFSQDVSFGLGRMLEFLYEYAGFDFNGLTPTCSGLGIHHRT
jgi:hypothetical protein